MSALVGVFLGLSPWFEGLNHGGSWSLATKTDFWSGLALTVLGLGTVMLYRRALTRQLVAANIVSRPTQLDEPVPQAEKAALEPISDAELLAVAASVVRNIQIEQDDSQDVDTRKQSQALATREEAPISEDELVKLATALLSDIQSSSPRHQGEGDPATPEPAMALMQESDLTRMAADLLQEIQAAKRSEALLGAREGDSHA